MQYSVKFVKNFIVKQFKNSTENSGIEGRLLDSDMTLNGPMNRRHSNCSL